MTKVHPEVLRELGRFSSEKLRLIGRDLIEAGGDDADAILYAMWDVRIKRLVAA